MNLSLIRSMTRSAVFELENGKCFRPGHPFAVALNGKTIYESCNTNVFSLFSLTPSTTYTYYQNHIKPKPQPKPESEKGVTIWRCRICGYEYKGDVLPDDFICPICKHPASDFEQVTG